MLESLRLRPIVGIPALFDDFDDEDVDDIPVNWNFEMSKCVVQYFNAKRSKESLSVCECDDGRPVCDLSLSTVSAISRNTQASPTALLLAMIYLDRLTSFSDRRESRLTEREAVGDCRRQFVSSVTAADLYRASLMVSSKYLEDDGIDEEVYLPDWLNTDDSDDQSLISSTQNNTKLAALKLLERNFISALDWNLHATPADLEAKLHQIESHILYRRIIHSDTPLTYAEMQTAFDRLCTGHPFSSCSSFVSLLCQIVTSLITVYCVKILALYQTAAILFNRNTSQCVSVLDQLNVTTDVVDQSLLMHADRPVLALHSPSDRLELDNVNLTDVPHYDRLAPLELDVVGHASITTPVALLSKGGGYRLDTILLVDQIVMCNHSFRSRYISTQLDVVTLAAG